MAANAELTGDNLHSLRAAQGWAELGNFHEANEELESITASLRSHPDALEVRWQIYAHAKQWAACVDVAEAMVRGAPSNPEAWLHRSYALHELSRTQEAFDQLLPAAKKFKKSWIVPYNLACYCAQLLRLDEARE
jgi:predicted Zn-dependent protease